MLTHSEIMAGLIDAIAILKSAKSQLLTAPNAVYALPYHAENYLNQRLASLLRGSDETV